MSNSIEHINDSQFEQVVIKSSTPVLVDFWAEWCGPCKTIAPVLDQLAQDYADKLKIVKVNVDENQQYAAQYKVRGIPTLLFFVDGELKKTHVGATNKIQLSQLIDSALA